MIYTITERDALLIYESLSRMDPDTLNDDLIIRGEDETSGEELDKLAARFQ